MKSIREVYNSGQKKWYIAGIYGTDIVLTNDRNERQSAICIEKLIADFGNQYKFIETISNDKETRDDFKKWFNKKNITILDGIDESIWLEDELICFSAEEYGQNSGKMTKQMLQGYWQNYIEKRLIKENK